MVISPGGSSTRPTSSAGAMFRLARPAPFTMSQETEGWRIEVEEGAEALVAHGPVGPRDYEGTLMDGIEAANRALDIVAIARAHIMSLEDVDHDNAVWWSDGSTMRTRLLMVLPYTANRRAMGTLCVLTGGGTVATSSQSAALSWNPSFHYFRASQLTDNLNDAYRNMWLAFENALSSRYPRQKVSSAKGKLRPEREIDWLKRGLTSLGTVMNLPSYTSASATGPVVDTLLDDLYTKHRLQLFHAKEQAKKPLPPDPRERAEVAAALDRLTRLYADLVRVQWGTSLPWTGVGPAWVHEFLSFPIDILLEGATADAAIARVSARADRRPSMTARWYAQLTLPTTPSVVHKVTAVVVRDGDRPDQSIAAVPLAAPIKLARVQILEIEFGIQVVNAGSSRSQFAR